LYHINEIQLQFWMKWGREKRLCIIPFYKTISRLPIRCLWLYPVFFRILVITVMSLSKFKPDVNEALVWCSINKCYGCFLMWGELITLATPVLKLSFKGWKENAIRMLVGGSLNHLCGFPLFGSRLKKSLDTHLCGYQGPIL